MQNSKKEMYLETSLSQFWNFKKPRRLQCRSAQQQITNNPTISAARANFSSALVIVHFLGPLQVSCLKFESCSRGVLLLCPWEVSFSFVSFGIRSEKSRSSSTDRWGRGWWWDGFEANTTSPRSSSFTPTPECIRSPKRISKLSLLLNPIK